MYQLDRDDLSLSAEVFLAQTGHNIIELLNKVLTNKNDLTKLVEQNNVEVISSDLPGLVVQAYLVLVRLFELDVMQPIVSTKVEETNITGPNSRYYINYEDESGVDSDDDFKVEMFDSDEFLPSEFEDDEPPEKRSKNVQELDNVEIRKQRVRDTDDRLLVRYLGKAFTEGQVR